MKIIFSDVDGTIYDSNKKLPKKTKDDIVDVQKLDCIFVPTTGNGLFKKMLSLAKSINAQYLISANGAHIFDLKLKKTMHAKFVEKDKVEEIIEIANNNKMGLYYWNEKKIYMNKYGDNENKLMIKKSMGLLPIISDNNLNDNILKMEIYGKKRKIQNIEKLLIKNGYHFVKMKDNHIEITHKDANKGFAINWLANKLNVDIKDCMMIGDSANDISALKIVGFSYAMANACANVKKYVKFHTSRVEQNGLSEAMEDYLYRIEKGMRE